MYFFISYTFFPFTILYIGHAPAHNGIIEEEIVQVLVNHAVHPVKQLPVAAFFPNVALRGLLTKDADNLPEFSKACFLDRGGEVGMRLPALRDRKSVV